MRPGNRGRTSLQHDRDGPVVDELDGHVLAEDAGRDGDALAAQLVAELVVEGLREVRRRGVHEARAVSLARIRDEGELAHDQRSAADVQDAAVELAAFVGEDPEPRDFSGGANSVGPRVIARDAEENDDAGCDLGGDDAVDANARLRDALADGSHLSRLRRIAASFTGTRARVPTRVG